MAEQTLDFWPDIEASRSRVTPLSIMKQQAALLGKRTNNLLEGRVSSSPGEGGLVYHRFTIWAPTLQYSYQVFMVAHGMIDLYPVRLVSGPHQTQYQNEWPQLDSQEAFVQWLKRVLSSEDTERVLSNLLAQIET